MSDESSPLWLQRRAKDQLVSADVGLLTHLNVGPGRSVEAQQNASVHAAFSATGPAVARAEEPAMRRLH